MHVTIENFGAVKNGEFDLKPLTVFVGHNNTGKTRTAYLASSVLSLVGGSYYADMYSDDRSEEKYNIIDQVVDDVIKNGTAGINLVDFYNSDDHQKFLTDMITSSKTWFKTFMATSKPIDDFKISMSFDRNLVEYTERLLQFNFEDGVGFGSDHNLNQKGILNVKKDANNPTLYFYTTEANIETKLPISIIRRFVYGYTFTSILHSFYNNISYLPAERTGIVALETSGSIAPKLDKRAKSRNHYKKVWVPLPIADLINDNRKYRDAAYRAKCENDSNKANKEIYNKLSAILEKHILSGNFNFTEPGKDGMSDFIFKYNGTLDIDMPLTSSSVKELMNLALYLKFEASHNDLLIIDEPEINLHPYTQAYFVEFIGMMVNSGLNVILTTHSPYIVDHLSNIIIANKKANAENIHVLEDMFFLKSRESFLSKDNVGAYLFDKGEIIQILKDSGLINWSTFGDVSSDLQNIFYNLINVDDT